MNYDQPSEMENKEKRKVVYTALFVDDIPDLLSKIQPKHSKTFGHHSTIAFKPKNIDDIELGKKSTIKIIGRAFDEKGDALLIENPKSNNKNPHITVSCAEGVSPVYSNELIEKSIADGTVEYFDEPLELAVTEGYFDGTSDQFE